MFEARVGRTYQERSMQSTTCKLCNALIIGHMSGNPGRTSEGSELLFRTCSEHSTVPICNWEHCEPVFPGV
eukprot:12782731-Heterocapsa_arctica.AAC.1